MTGGRDIALDSFAKRLWLAKLEIVQGAKNSSRFNLKPFSWIPFQYLLTIAARGSSTTCSRGAGAAALGKKMLMRFPMVRQWTVDSARKE